MVKNLGKILAFGALILASLLGSQYHVNKIDDKYVNKMRKYRHEAEDSLNLSSDTIYKYCHSAKMLKIARDQSFWFAKDNPGHTIDDSKELEAQMDSLNLFAPKIIQKYLEDKGIGYYGAVIGAKKGKVQKEKK